MARAEDLEWRCHPLAWRRANCDQDGAAWRPIAGFLVGCIYLPKRRNANDQQTTDSGGGFWRGRLLLELKRERYEAGYRPRAPGSGCGECAPDEHANKLSLVTRLSTESVPTEGMVKLKVDEVQKGPGHPRCGLKVPQPDLERVRQARGARLPLLLKHSGKSFRRFVVALTVSRTKRAPTMMPALGKGAWAVVIGYQPR